MIVYNTTFHIEKEILEEAVLHLRKSYIPQAAAGGFLHAPCLRRVIQMNEEGEGESYSVQFHVKNIETLQYWLEKEGNRLHQKLIERFGSKIVGFTTLLDEIDWAHE